MAKKQILYNGGSLVRSYSTKKGTNRFYHTKDKNELIWLKRVKTGWRSVVYTNPSKTRNWGNLTDFFNPNSFLSKLGFRDKARK